MPDLCDRLRWVKIRHWAGDRRFFWGCNCLYDKADCSCPFTGVSNSRDFHSIWPVSDTTSSFNTSTRQPAIIFLIDVLAIMHMHMQDSSLQWLSYYVTWDEVPKGPGSIQAGLLGCASLPWFFALSADVDSNFLLVCKAPPGSFLLLKVLPLPTRSWDSKIEVKKKFKSVLMSLRIVWIDFFWMFDLSLVQYRRVISQRVIHSKQTTFVWVIGSKIAFSHANLTARGCGGGGRWTVASPWKISVPARTASLLGGFPRIGIVEPPPPVNGVSPSSLFQPQRPLSQ